MEILFLTTVLPGGRSTGGEIASHAVVDAIAAHGHAVTVVGYLRPAGNAQPGAGAVVVGRRSIEADAAPLVEKARWSASALVARLPVSAAKYRSRGYMRALRALTATRRFDLAVVDHAQIGWVLPELERARLPFATLLHNVEHAVYVERARTSRGVARLAYRREARLVGRLEGRVAREAREAWLLSECDAASFARFGTTRVLRLPPPAAGPSPAAKARDVAILGTWTWQVNRAGLEWFLERVAPELGDDVAVEIAGRGGDFAADRRPNVRYRGFVADAMEFLAGARAVAVPSVGGSGVQVKTLDAIASGNPVVSTAVGVRGLGTVPRSVRVEDDPAEFAAALREALRAESAPDDALEWARVRRERFAADVAEAVEAAAR